MNFLQLCQMLRSEAGIPGDGPTTVVSQTGQLLRVVQWIEEAYESIQSLHANWQFLQTSFSFSTIAGQAEYTPTGVSLTDLLNWKVDDFRVYLNASDENYLIYEPWETFRPNYQFGALRSQSARPTVFTVKPNKSLFFWAIPDTVYTIDGQYFKTPDVLSGDIDSPLFDAPFHMAIVWRALMLYAGALGAPDAYSHARHEYRKVMFKLEFDQLPKMTFGAPLA